MQGVPAGFGLTAVVNYLIGRNLSPAVVASFAAAVGLPWAIQFVWGPLIDKYQYSIIGHRKQWVVLTQLIAALASLSLLLVHDPVAQLPLMTGAFVVHSIFASIQDASVDAIAIAVVPEAERGRVNAFMRGGMLIGGSAGAAGLTAVLHHYGFFWAALVQSGVLLALTVLTFSIRLDRTDTLLPVRGQRASAAALNAENPPVSWLFRELLRAITERHTLRLFLVVALAYMTLSVFGWAYSYHLIQELHWSDQAVSVMQGSWGSVATLALIVGGGIVADRVGAAYLQRWVLGTLAAFLLLFCSLSLFWHYTPVATLGLLFWNMADPSLSVAALPLLMALCRPQIEGSQFTTYMALVNLSGVSGSYLTGWALTWVRAPTLGLLCGLLLLVLFGVLQWLRRQPAAVATHT
ncbi:MFS transporter, PAT family, beta-lactamase induction signal transducer AmpG [Hymenobacter mucosus]|uniref:MFS transporter, PAT family, beta-lactamase induction signal transducer AmpG n=2 Tax=Hymenobacter mucosus TaxID=1411120 RepID=A0A238WCX8_9BACT|nr:MFS transporter, PAT family, beta-lactamase induction signal transducer AmpG [Hymenobacter mucosus]